MKTTINSLSFKGAPKVGKEAEKREEEEKEYRGDFLSLCFSSADTASGTSLIFFPFYLFSPSLCLSKHVIQI